MNHHEQNVPPPPKNTALLITLALSAIGATAYFATQNRQPENQNATPPAQAMPQPSAAERKEVRDTLLAHVSQEHCDAEIGGDGYDPSANNILVWQHDGKRDYLALWWASADYYTNKKADGSPETICSGGSATSSFYLAHLVRRDNRLHIAEQDMLAK